ncbi:trans-aconitate 2-methyltransferase [Aeromicrobium sp. Leaf350]|uniref:class I SAM-dependent methyltransferase n=1 Tax=Aeromicrobium sp. Leaf350 TaxID=2876565 RepID=UPI001E3D8BC7|nr:SAM-dependent methyltransferase [Aeromicrobium sp. Leaf350]
MTAPEYFTDMYARSADPWHLGEREYEHRKYGITVASLPHRSYGRAFEPGCSIGLLTALLAPRCDELLATDAVAAPLEQARRTVPDPHVRFEQASLPHEWPDGELDLVVLSEVLYFLSAEARAQVRARVLEGLSAEGHLVVVHWRHPFDEADCTGDDAHRELGDEPGLTTIVSHVEDDFRLEVMGRA